MVLSIPFAMRFHFFPASVLNPKFVDFVQSPCTMRNLLLGTPLQFYTLHLTKRNEKALECLASHLLIRHVKTDCFSLFTLLTGLH